MAFLGILPLTIDRVPLPNSEGESNQVVADGRDARVYGTLH